MSDVRVRQFEERSDRAIIFVVDASGSAALARLAEAKGAIELLLGEAYARRDHVALVAFRGDGADILLPPTRSLVQTKRRLGQFRAGAARRWPRGSRRRWSLPELASPRA
jgi:magnesium chelatase subunit D